MAKFSCRYHRMFQFVCNLNRNHSVVSSRCWSSNLTWATFCCSSSCSAPTLLQQINKKCLKNSVVYNTNVIITFINNFNQYYSLCFSSYKRNFHVAEAFIGQPQEVWAGRLGGFGRLGNEAVGLWSVVAGDLAGGRSISIFRLRDLRLLPAVFEVILFLKQIKLLSVHVTFGWKNLHSECWTK